MVPTSLNIMFPLSFLCRHPVYWHVFAVIGGLNSKLGGIAVSNISPMREIPRLILPGKLQMHQGVRNVQGQSPQNDLPDLIHRSLNITSIVIVVTEIPILCQTVVVSKSNNTEKTNNDKDTMDKVFDNGKHCAPFCNVKQYSMMIYTEGSKDHGEISGGELHILTLTGIMDIEIEPPNFCLILRSEHISIRLGSKIEVQFQDLWIMTDSRASVQHLFNWASIEDQNGLDVLYLLDRISSNHREHFQWVPSQVGIDGNEKADFLVRTAAAYWVSYVH
ncbi:RNase H domain-containing protein [Trichonephila clavipes]|nr:RNase H domain-containing protein [Trichonephila clavipes]